MNKIMHAILILSLGVLVSVANADTGICIKKSGRVRISSICKKNESLVLIPSSSSGAQGPQGPKGDSGERGPMAVSDSGVVTADYTGYVSPPNPANGNFKWNLDSGIGDRKTTPIYVPFKKIFTVPPTVIISIKGFDAIGGITNTRINVDTTEVKADGFLMYFETWSDSALYVVNASWIAIGE